MVGAAKPIALPASERVTAVAYLPAKPAWDANLGPVVAVAYRFERSQGVRLTLYDALTAKPLYQLGGPTLPLKSLAFSGARPISYMWRTESHAARSRGKRAATSVASSAT